MSFERPWLLLLALIPAALIAWELLRRGVETRVPLDHAEHPDRPWTRRVLFGSAALPPLLLGVAIAILAGPRRAGEQKDERVLTNIEFCLDVSGSMGSPLGDGREAWQAAIEAIQDFTKKREGDAFGLTIFGNEVVRWIPLTTDLAAIRSVAPFMDPSRMPPFMGGTSIGHALKFCGRTLASQPEGDRLIVLVSDGYSSDLGGGAASHIASELAAEGVVVYMIQIGDGDLPPETYEVVQPTGGEALRAGDTVGLASVFAHIDRMRPVKVKPGAPDPVDNFLPFALAGLGALGLHTVALLGLRWTPW